MSFRLSSATNLSVAADLIVASITSGLSQIDANGGLIRNEDMIDLDKAMEMLAQEDAAKGTGDP